MQINRSARNAGPLRGCRLACQVSFTLGLSMSSFCKCQSPPFCFSDYSVKQFGEDSTGANVSIETCLHCGRKWLKYIIEEPHYSQSGRWWRVLIATETVPSVSAHAARSYIEAQTEVFRGGSYFRTSGEKILGPLHIA
jgi:hypothetical protein